MTVAETMATGSAGLTPNNWLAKRARVINHPSRAAEAAEGLPFPVVLKPLTRKQKTEVRALAEMPDRRIDYSDMSRLPASFLEGAVRGGLYRPVRRQFSLRIDAGGQSAASTAN